MQSRTTIEQQLATAKREYAVALANGRFDLELQMKVARLEAARYWSKGAAERLVKRA